MNTTSSTSLRALVLGGGGAAGNAWLIGVIAGLSDGGLDVTNADRIVGTSAGATAAAQISSESPAGLYAAILDSPAPPPRTYGALGPLSNQLERTQQIIDESNDAAEMRRGMGKNALELAGTPDRAGTDRWRAIVAGRMSADSWPDRDILLTAVDAETGDPLAFDRDSGVDLVDAVAASTSGGPAYNIGEHWYIDGGYRRNENADLAAGFERVLVLSPLGGRTRHPLEWGLQLAAQVDELAAGGSRVETILPDAESLAAFGDNMMDLSRRPDAARAGHRQGTNLAAQLTEFWG